MTFLAHVLWAFALVIGIARADDASAVLKIKSSVAGAEVYIDGTLVGNAPLTKFLPAGAHQLRIVADFHDPYVRRVELEADRTLEVNATLVKGNGTIEFTGPAGAHVFTGGVDRGPVPIRLPSPGAGSLAWKVSAPGFESAEGVLTVVAGRNHLVPVTLETSAGVFEVTSEPAGARVRLDGADIGVTPVKVKGIAEGVHGVEVTLDGNVRHFASVDTSGGKRGEVAARLVKGTGASITLTTGKDSARVFLNDAPVGAGSSVTIENAPRGRVQLRVTDVSGSITGTVTVPSSGTLALRVSGNTIEEKKKLTEQWGFWAAIGGGVAAGGTVAAVVAVANQPEPPPVGDEVVTLP
jgi:hypothetical protein